MQKHSVTPNPLVPVTSTKMAEKRKRLLNATIIWSSVTGVVSCLVFFFLAAYVVKLKDGNSSMNLTHLKFYVFDLPVLLEMLSGLVIILFSKKIVDSFIRYYGGQKTTLLVRLTYLLLGLMFANLGWLVAYMQLRLLGLQS